MGLAGLWVSIGLGVAPWPVTGGSACPTPAELRTELLAMGSTLPERAYGVTLEDGPEALWVRLVAPDGAVRAEKSLPRQGASCAELASAAAAVVSAWAWGLPDALPRPAPPPEPPSPPSTVVEPTPPSWGQWAARLGLFASGSGGVVVPSGELGVLWGRAPSGLALSAALSMSLPREMPLGEGRVRWQRTTLGLGVQVPLAARPALLLGHLDALVGLLSANGTQFEQNYARRALEPGVRAGLRVGIGPEKGHGFLGLSGSYWPRPQTFRVTGLAESIPVPSWELWLGGGFQWAL